MKQRILLLLVFILGILLLAACETSAPPAEGDGSSAPEESTTETPPAVTTVPEENTALPDDAYLLLPRYETADYAYRSFAFTENGTLLTLMLPTAWQLDAEDGGYLLTRGGEPLGSLQSGLPTDGDAWRTVSESDGRVQDLQYAVSVEREADGDEFRYRFLYEYEEDGEARTVTLTVPCTEVSAATEENLRYFSFLTASATDPQFGALGDTDAARSILIVGNSFVNSSQVGELLIEMCAVNGKSTRIRWISRGYATVKTYAEDAALMAEVRNGAYGAVLICGFYDAGEAEHLKTVKAACDASGTALIAFPAHNESRSAVDYALTVNAGVRLLDWKGEIETLLDAGHKESDFCVNDSHKHSTTLAGYVGAHLIYRAVFGTVPSGSVSGTISQSRVNAILGEYVTSGQIPLGGAEEIYVLS